MMITSCEWVIALLAPAFVEGCSMFEQMAEMHLFWYLYAFKMFQNQICYKENTSR